MVQSKIENLLTQWVWAHFHLNEDNDECLLINPDLLRFGSAKSGSNTNDVLSVITAFRKLHNHPLLFKQFLNFQSSSNENDVGCFRSSISRFERVSAFCLLLGFIIFKKKKELN